MITFLLIEKGKITMLFNNKELQSNFDIGKICLMNKQILIV